MMYLRYQLSLTMSYLIPVISTPVSRVDAEPVGRDKASFVLYTAQTHIPAGLSNQAGRLT